MLCRSLARVLDGDPFWATLVDQLSNQDFAAHGTSSDLLLRDKVRQLRQVIWSDLGVPYRREAHPGTLWCATTAAAWATIASDIDQVFLGWQTDACPLGAARPVVPGGMFPPAHPTDEA